MLKLASIITGDDYQMLKSDTPYSRKKVNTFVGVLFLPVLMWTINIYLLQQSVLKGSVLASIISSLIAGTIIFIIERSIIMANGSKLVMIFRVFLGFLIAILGSMAFDEVIFKDDIDQQLSTYKSNLLRESDCKIDAIYAPAIQSKESEVASKHQIWMGSLDKASKESDGSGGSGYRGVSEITRLKLSIAVQNEQDYTKSKSELGTLLAKREKDKLEATAKIESSFNNHALLLRIKGMFDLICNNGWMCFIYIVVSLVLFLLEFMVVILKLSLPKSNYELKLETIEEIGRKRLLKIMNNDPTHFEVAMQYPTYQQTKENVRKLTSESLFN